MAVRLPGAYTTSTLHLRSFVRIFIETEATIFSSKDVSTYDEKALLYGEDLEHITIEGPGVINGQAEYEWGLSDHDDRYIIGNPRRMEALGKPLMRSFPTENSIGNLLLLKRCKDVWVRDVSFIDSPSWTIVPEDAGTFINGFGDLFRTGYGLLRKVLCICLIVGMIDRILHNFKI